MKNLTKIAILLIIIGLLSIGTAFALSGGDLTRFSMAGTPENKQYQASASDVTELVVKASIADVTVTGADQSDIKIDYTEDRSINYNIKQEGSRHKGHLSLSIRPGQGRPRQKQKGPSP